MHLPRVILGSARGCPLLSSPCLWLGPLFPPRRRSRTCWPCLVLYCTAEELPRVLGSEPCVTQLQFKGYKGKGFASRLNTSKRWQQLLDQIERKEVACGSPKQTRVSEEKQDPEESYWETMRKKLLIYVEQKPESSRNSPSCFHIQSIFSLAHMEWASANFLPQTRLFLSILRKKQES